MVRFKLQQCSKGLDEQALFLLYVSGVPSAGIVSIHDTKYPYWDQVLLQNTHTKKKRSQTLLSHSASVDSSFMVYVICFRSPSVGNVSMGGQSSVPFTVRYDKLDSTEIRDLLCCFLYVVANLAQGESKLLNMHIGLS